MAVLRRIWFLLLKESKEVGQFHNAFAVMAILTIDELLEKEAHYSEEKHRCFIQT